MALLRNAPVLVVVGGLAVMGGAAEGNGGWCSCIRPDCRRRVDGKKKPAFRAGHQCLLRPGRRAAWPGGPRHLSGGRIKNWAALDGLGGKLDSISTQIEGSVDKANQSEVSRAKIRALIGSQTMQRADLK
jgi:hypothetical protein